MSWLSKQFRSFKKHVIPKEIRKPFTSIGKAVPNEITGFWDDAMEGSKQLGEAIGFPGVKSDHTKGEEEKIAAAQAEADRVMPIPDEEELKRVRRRRMSRQQGYGRSSTVLGGNSETLG